MNRFIAFTLFILLSSAGQVQAQEDTSQGVIAPGFHTLQVEL